MLIVDSYSCACM